MIPNREALPPSPIGANERDNRSDDQHRDEILRLTEELEEKFLREEGSYSLRIRKLIDDTCGTFIWRGIGFLRRFVYRLGPLTGIITGIWRHFLKTNDAGYADWVRTYDTLSPEETQLLAGMVERFPSKPLISIVMPVYETPEKWLRRSIESVLAQIYPHWELCIADDASPSPHVRRVLTEYERLDSRIRVVYRQTNGHISAASNSALELATGEFIALLDHDDEIPPHALALVAHEIGNHPDVDIIYSDEDKIDEKGRRFHPLFKPDWNPDLFFSQNYVSHLGVYRTSLVRKVGGFRTGYEGSQDYDLCIRCVASTAPSRIRHIPFILYHWRTISGSTARSTQEKQYAEDAAVKALSEHFATIDPRITVTPGEGHTTYVVTYPLPTPPPMVSIIIPTRNAMEILRRCISSIRELTDYPAYQITVVDNQSDDPATIEYLRSRARNGEIRLLHYDAPFNYSAINNMAVRESAGEIICLLNNDIQVISGGWLTEMVRHAVRPEIGAVGAKLLYPNGRIQHGGVVLGLGGVAGHIHHGYFRQHFGYFGRLILVQNLSAVTGACLVVRKSLYEEVGGFDEINLPVALNDIDFCLKLCEAGYRNLWTPRAELYHHESYTRGGEDTPEKRGRFIREAAYLRTRWKDMIVNDPCYNPNLTLEAPNFTPACPPRVRKPWIVNEHHSDTPLLSKRH